MSCEPARELMSLWIDGCLSATEEQRLARHLAECELCRRELADLERTVSLLRDVKPVKVPVGLIGRVHERLETRRSVGQALWAALSMPSVRAALAATIVLGFGVYAVNRMGHVAAPRDTFKTDLELAEAPVAAGNLKGQRQVAKPAVPADGKAAVVKAEAAAPRGAAADQLRPAKEKAVVARRFPASKSLGGSAPSDAVDAKEEDVSVRAVASGAAPAARSSASLWAPASLPASDPDGAKTPTGVTKARSPQPVSARKTVSKASSRAGSAADRELKDAETREPGLARTKAEAKSRSVNLVVRDADKRQVLLAIAAFEQGRGRGTVGVDKLSKKAVLRDETPARQAEAATATPSPAMAADEGRPDPAVPHAGAPIVEASIPAGDYPALLARLRSLGAVEEVASDGAIRAQGGREFERAESGAFHAETIAIRITLVP